MYLVAIAWLYVALMMALAEAMHPSGGWLGAVVTFVFYGLAPVGLVMYLLGTPMRRQARRRDEKAEMDARATAAAVAALPATGSVHESVGEPDDGGHAAGLAVAPVRKEP
jgi:uncharacterized membrane protein